MSWVFEHSESRLAARHVLMSIANHADAAGENSWPSVPTIARESRLSVREVQNSVRELVDIGELDLEIGAGPKGTNLYRLLMMSPAKSAPRKDCTGADYDAKGCNLRREGVQTVPRNKEEPSLTIQEPSGGETPPDLEPLQYAHGLLEQIGFPVTRQNNIVVAAAITALVNSGKSKAAAYEFLLAKAKDAIDAGESVDKFWFEDAKWRRNGRQQASAAERRTADNRENIVDTLTNHARKSSGPGSQSDGEAVDVNRNRVLGAGTRARRAGAS